MSQSWGVNIKILLIHSKMSQGGPTRALINLAHVLLESRIDVEILLFSKGGLLQDRIPKGITIQFTWPQGIYSSKYNGLLDCCISIPVKLLAMAVHSILNRVFGFSGNYKSVIKNFFLSSPRGVFDLAMSMSEGSTSYYLATKTISATKIARIPTDYITAGLNAKFDIKYYSRLDYLFSITPGTQARLAQAFPSLKGKMRIFELITPRSLCIKESNENIKIAPKGDRTLILTLARVDTSKGIDLVINTCKVLKTRNFRFIWYYVGDGEHDKWRKSINDHELKDVLCLLPAQVNPFPFIKHADIYIQPSRYEGKSNAINEAKAMAKPIILVNFPTAYEIIDNGVDGIISDRSPNKLAEAVIQLANDEKLMKRFSEYWVNNFDGNEDQVQTLLRLCMHDS